MFRRGAGFDDGVLDGKTAAPAGARARVAAVRGGARPVNHALAEPVRADSGWVPGAARRSGAADAGATTDGVANFAAGVADLGQDGERVVLPVEAGEEPGNGGPHEPQHGGARAEVDHDQSRWKATLTEAGPWHAMAEKWVPEPLRGARVDPGRRGAAVLSVVAAVAAVAAAIGVWWSKPSPTPLSSSSLVTRTEPSSALGDVNAALPDLDAVPPAANGEAPGGAASVDDSRGASGAPATPATDAAGPILVSVTGKVHRPGLVTVAPGARVADAIAAAGGALDDADLTGLNLAARLGDGGSIVVAGPGGGTVQDGSTGSDGPAGPAGTASDGSATVNLNTADLSTLQTLPGVGPVTAAAILAYRTEHGPFTDVAQLEEVSGIGPATMARLRAHVTV